MTVSFTITVDDFVAYLRLAQRTLNRVGAAIGAATVAIGVFIAVFSHDLSTGVFAIVVGVVFYALATTEYFDRWRVQRSARSFVGTTASFTFDSNGIAAQTVTGSGRIPWDALTQLLENDRVLVIKRDRVSVAWIPKRAFTSADELDAVRALIIRHVQQLADAAPGPGAGG